MTVKETKGVSISNDEKYERRKLADCVPLDTPYSIDFAPTTFCNIKCICCAHSSKHPDYQKIIGQTMDKEMIFKAIDDLKEFPNRVKAMHFCGLGEPLMHKDIAEMLTYAKSAGVAEKVDISTNGTLMTNKTADAIIDSGVDYIRISLNGLSTEDFQKYTDTPIEYSKLVKNLTYLYKNRKNTKIYIKIFNFMVESEESKKKYFDTFEPICDSISIENYNECFLDTKGKGQLEDTNKNQRGEASIQASVCPQPYFKLLVLVNGDVVPCCEPLFNTFSLGNISDLSLKEIWNGQKLNKFRLDMLDGMEKTNDVCKNCLSVKVNCYSADNIDSETDRLKKHYREMLNAE